MSELKERDARELVINNHYCPSDEGMRVYLKSEADKVIADLEESHKMEVEQLLMETVELKKEKEYTIECTTEVINAQEREIRHQKYRRCLAMYHYCAIKALYELDLKGNDVKWKWYSKWMHKWFKLAEKFKEAK